MFSVCVIKHLLERGVIIIHIFDEPLLGDLLLSQWLCEGLDMILHEVVFGLITCMGVGFARRPHLVVGGVQCYCVSSWMLKGSRSCWRLKEIKKSRKLDWMKSSNSKSDAHFMHGWDDCKHADNLSHAMWCAMSEDDDDTNWQEDYVHIHLSSSVAFHVLRVGVGFHVVIGVGRLVVRFHHAYVIPSFSSWCCSPTLSCHRQLRVWT